MIFKEYFFKLYSLYFLLQQYKIKMKYNWIKKNSLKRITDIYHDFYIVKLLILLQVKFYRATD